MTLIHPETAAAHEKFLEFSKNTMLEMEKQFTQLVTDQLDENKERLNDAADQLKLKVTQLISDHQNRLQISKIHVENLSQAFMKKQESQLKQLSVVAKNETSRYVVRQTHLLDFSGNKLSFVFKGQLLKSKNQMNQFEHLVKIQAQELIRAEKKNLTAMAEKLRLVDPMNVLKRGYSLTMIDGKIIKSVEKLKNGDRLVTHLSDGTVESTVDKVYKKS